MIKQTEPHNLSLCELAGRLGLPQDHLDALASNAEIPYQWSEGARRFNQTAVRCALDGRTAAGIIRDADALLDSTTTSLLFETAGKKLLDFVRDGTLSYRRIAGRVYFRRRDVERLLGGAIHGPTDWPAKVEDTTS
jgi:hypothetical protein